MDAVDIDLQNYLSMIDEQDREEAKKEQKFDMMVDYIKASMLKPVKGNFLGKMKEETAAGVLFEMMGEMEIGHSKALLSALLWSVAMHDPELTDAFARDVAQFLVKS